MRFTLLNNSLRCDLIPKILCSSVKSTSTSAAPYPGICNPHVLTPSVRSLILFHQFLCFFTGLTVHLSMSGWTLVAEFAFPIQFCNVDMRQETNDHVTDSCNSLSSNSCTVFDFSFRMAYFSLEVFPLEDLLSFWCLRSWSRRGPLC